MPSLGGIKHLNKLTDPRLNALTRLCPLFKCGGDKYTTDWFHRLGDARYVVRPDSVGSLSEIMRYCNSEKIGVNIIGGNTGLVGSTLSGTDELLISLEKMNQILEIDTQSSVAIVESGVILENLQSELSKQNMVTPYDLGSRGSCSIGGNLSTNAGGNNFIRHGPLRGHVVGLEVVTASGQIIDLMTKCRKDNTGYDLKQMFIGSEGTLGIITKAALHCPVLPRYKSVALLVSRNPNFTESVLPALTRARTILGETLTAFEFMDSHSLRSLPELPSGISSNDSQFGILIECSSNVRQIELDSYIEKSLIADPTVSGIVASDLTGMQKLWHYRDTVSSAVARLGPNLKYDLSLPHHEYYEIVEKVRQEFGSDPRVKVVVGYGHVGDGNVHLNVALMNDESYDTEIGQKISDYVYSHVKACKGSISAEHGIGRDKVTKLHYSKSPEAIDMMYLLKNTLDPNGILNPGRVLQ